jgi:hypothetical protein
MRNNVMTTRNINNPRTRLKALRYNPSLKIIGPSPVSTTRLDNCEATNKSLTICHAKSPALNGAVLTRTSMLRNIRIQWDGGGAYGYLNDSNLIARRVGSITGKLVASPNYIGQHGAPETPDELLTHQALMQGTETWQFIDGDKTISVHPQGRFKADNGTALAAAAVAGLGIALLPDHLIEGYLDSSALVQVMPRYPVPTGGMFVVRPPGQHSTRKVRVLTELLIEHFG